MPREKFREFIETNIRSENTMRITVIGSGYVGLVSAVCFAGTGTRGAIGKT